MDTGIRHPKESPKKSARLFSKLIFVWLIKLFYKGNKRTLQVTDLYKPMPSDESAKLADKLEQNWFKEVERSRGKKTKPSLLRALSHTFIRSYLAYGLLLFLQYGIIRAFPPVVLAMFIQLFSETEMEHKTRLVFMCVYGAILILLTGVVVFLNHHTNLELSRIGMRIRIACCSVVYRKILRLSKKSLGQTASGQIVNLLSNDVQRFDLVAPMLHFFWIMPIQAALITYFIWEQVHISAFAGVVAMILMTIPVQGYMGKVTSVLRLKIAKRTDYRVKLMNEIISGVQVIKMYAWEQPFENMVKIARSKEIKYLTYASYLRGIYSSFAVFTERTTLFFSVVCYYLLGNEITADRVFSMAQFFNILQLSMAIFFPLAVALGAESLVSIERLEDVLHLEEKTESSVLRTLDKEIILKDIQASWTEDVKILNNLNLKIPEGCLCAVVGPVGAGKSSLLQLFLGELKHESGSVQIGGSISYASQEPWLFVATVRQNILFGKDYERETYQKTVKVCALERDFELFPQGDKTLVGERGVSLSGGQRARINLARAVYREADIYLLDDPLSAVDTHVAKHLFEECIVDHLKGKTRILVTHQLQFLKKADYIIVLNEGNVEAHGTFEELSSSDLSFTKLLVNAEEGGETEKPSKMTRTRTTSMASAKSIPSQSENLEAYDEKNEETVLSQGREAYFQYAKAGGNFCILLFLIFLLFLGQGVTSGGDYWLTYWTTLGQTTFSETDHFNMYVYVMFIGACIVFTTLRSIVYFKLCMRASKNLHNKMFHGLLEAPMRFFDTNPSGRILNRFSRDMGAIDEILPRVSMDAVQILLVMIGILIMITIANYYMVIAALILGVFFYKLRTWYIKSAKDIKHLEGITKSPMFSHLNASLNGILTIRATNSQIALKSEFDTHQNLHTSAWYLTLACVAAFGIWLDVICLIFVGIVTFSFVIMSEFTEVSGSYVGLAISQALILTGMLQFGMRQTAEVVSQMTCVERVLEYTQLTKEETEKVKAVLDDWPNQGRIEFVHVYLKYSHLDPTVLKDLNVVIEPSQKVGIVGRTGAGKSSMLSALFRLAPIDGSIIIDGIDTNTLNLKDLRCKISIIPQEPVLFSATMRFNLDPFEEFNDEALWNALKEVELKDSVPSLDFLIEEGGGNFSVGQRQLICLARAILRNNRILVLDEATANVDHRTDSLIQDTIRKKFLSCTVLTIAHRLNTIMDADKVLVMEAGRIIEFDHPYNLLQNRQGHFYKMVAQTGPSMSARLLDMAEKSYVGCIQEKPVNHSNII